MFTFYKFAHGGDGDLYTEERLAAVTSTPLTLGAALCVTGELLDYADTASKVYAICNVSAASGDVSAGYIPQVIPVNSNQIWKGFLNVAITAVCDIGGAINLAAATALGTALNGAVGSGNASAAYLYGLDSTTTASNAFVIFPSPTERL